MKTLFASVVALALIGGAAYAADSMTGLYGNTLVAHQPDGTDAKIMYKQDKSYSAVDGKGAKVSGTWDVAGGQLCTMQTTPPPAAGMGKLCGPELPAGKKAGDSWETTASDGVKYKLSIVAGQ